VAWIWSRIRNQYCWVTSDRVEKGYRLVCGGNLDLCQYLEPKAHGVICQCRCFLSNLFCFVLADKPYRRQSFCSRSCIRSHSSSHLYIRGSHVNAEAGQDRLHCHRTKNMRGKRDHHERLMQKPCGVHEVNRKVHSLTVLLYCYCSLGHYFNVYSCLSVGCAMKLCMTV
jgi:hypothetical protein